MTDKSAGIIVEHQLEQVGFEERLIHSFMGVFGVVCILRLVR